MMVYILIFEYDETEEIIGVYSSEERAKEKFTEIKKKSYWAYNYRIDSWKIDHD